MECCGIENASSKREKKVGGTCSRYSRGGGGFIIFFCMVLFVKKRGVGCPAATCCFVDVFYAERQARYSTYLSCQC
jgi:hypothetical protein